MNCPRFVAAVVLIIVLLAPVNRTLGAGKTSEWRSLSPGLDLKLLALKISNSPGDTWITILRIDPNLWELQLVGTSLSGEQLGHTAREWCEKEKFTAAINAGMFGADQKTHLGYARLREHVYNSRLNAYQSVAAFDPQDPQAHPRFHIFDLDTPGVRFENIQKDYASVVQNLRLIRRPGQNQWSQQTRKWSEAALGEDDMGRILFIFSRSPLSMHDLNRELLSGGVGLVAAQHLEGGPEAQLYLQVGGTQLEKFGSFETSFREDDKNPAAWPVPNVLGIRPRSSHPQN
jgi:Phosphodiester glycosidase